MDYRSQTETKTQTTYANGQNGGRGMNGAQHGTPIELDGPQRALITTISEGQDSIEKANNTLNEKAQLPPLGNDPASYRWKETQKNTNKQSVHSQVSAMNAATAQMVTLTGHGDDTDHTSVGAAVKTISTRNGQRHPNARSLNG
jgi:talin